MKGNTQSMWFKALGELGDTAPESAGKAAEGEIMKVD